MGTKKRAKISLFDSPSSPKEKTLDPSQPPQKVKALDPSLLHAEPSHWLA